MAALFTQAEVEKILGLQPGQATGGYAQNLINSNPAAKAKYDAAVAAKVNPAPQPLSQLIAPATTPSTWMDPRNAREQAVRDAGYTGAFGAGGGDAWLMQNYGSTATPSAPPAQKGNWNEDVATVVGQVFGLLPEGQMATGGALDQAVANADPQTAADYKAVALALQTGTMTPNDLLDSLADIQIQKQEAGPEYGKLAQAPYPEFKPFTLDAFMKDPGYDFRLSEGQKAIDTAQGARGNFYSGRALKEAQQYGQDFASGEFDKAYNRYNTNFGIGYSQAKGDSDTLYNRLVGLSSSGQNATNTAINSGSNSADNISNILLASGQNKANSAIQQGNNISNTLSDILSRNIGKSTYTLPWQKPGNVNPQGGYY